MTTARRTPSLSLPFSYSLGVCALVLASTACVGFIGGDDSSDNEAGETGDGDGDGDNGDGDGDPGTETSVYAIQQGEIAEGMNVRVTGVIVTSPVNVEDGLAFVEEPEGGQYSGIALYLWSEVVMATPIAPGDVVELTAEYTEFFGLSQLVVKNPGDLVVTGTAELPEPELVTAAEVARTNPAAEPWEGVRVQIVDAVIADSNDGFGQYLLEGDALVGHAFVDPLPNAQAGGSFGSISGPLYYSFDEFKLMPASASDLVDYTPGPPPAEDTEIYAVQQGMVEVGEYLKLEGVIASTGLTWSDTAEASFFIQEPAGGEYSGIQVHVADSAGLDIAVGDELTVVGTYDEFFELSQIELTDASGVTVTGSVAPPTAAVIGNPADIATGGALAEPYEGVLVRVEGVTVVDDALGFGVFSVTGDLRVDDIFFEIADWTVPAVGTGFESITGVVIFGFDEFGLAPRDAADLVGN